MPVPRGSACKPACLRDRRARLVLLRRLPARRHDLRPRRTAVRLRRPERRLPATTRRAAAPLRTRGGVMPGQPRYDFVYVHTDIPEGMTIPEWRAHCSTVRAAERQAAGEARRSTRFDDGCTRPLAHDW